MRKKRQKDLRRFLACLDGLLRTEQVQAMEKIRHHPGVSCYEHCRAVSYTAFRLARLWGADEGEAARAGLLHDLYLYDPRSLRPYRQCFAHPVAALRNAAALCGGLSAREADAILAHMWPLAKRRPHSREAAAVCLADKLCSGAELLRLLWPAWRSS